MICSFRLCDKCGVILTDSFSEVQFNPDPTKEYPRAILSLCPRCTAQFESDYLRVKKSLEGFEYPQQRAEYISKKERIRPKEDSNESS